MKLHTWNDTREEMESDNVGQDVMLAILGGISHKSRFGDYVSLLIH